MWNDWVYVFLSEPTRNAPSVQLTGESEYIHFPKRYFFFITPDGMTRNKLIPNAVKHYLGRGLGMMIWKDVSYENYIWNLVLGKADSLGLILSANFEDTEKTIWTSKHSLEKCVKTDENFISQSIYRNGVYKFTKKQINCARNVLQNQSTTKIKDENVLHSADRVSFCVIISLGFYNRERER